MIKTHCLALKIETNKIYEFSFIVFVSTLKHSLNLYTFESIYFSMLFSWKSHSSKKKVIFRAARNTFITNLNVSNLIYFPLSAAHKTFNLKNKTLFFSLSKQKTIRNNLIAEFIFLQQNFNYFRLNARIHNNPTKIKMNLSCKSFHLNRITCVQTDRKLH